MSPYELFRSLEYTTAIYRSELALRLKEQGYDIERGRSGQPEIRGYTRQYLDASSPRRRQIQAYLEEQGFRSAGAAQIAVHQTRDGKLPAITHEAMQLKHRELAAHFGQQEEPVIRAAEEHHIEEQSREQKNQSVESALTYAQEKNLKRHAVMDERELMRDTLKHSMGEAGFADVREQFENRVQSGDLIQVENRSPSRLFTTQEMIGYERNNIAQMRAGQNRHEPMVSSETWREVEGRHAHLSASQSAAVEQIVSSPDKIMGLEGVAGAGKIASLAAVRDAAEQGGYQVRGLAPTSRAAHTLAESGIESETLYRHLHSKEQPEHGEKRLYILDEASLAITKQMNEFLDRLQGEDRVLLVGDPRQHDDVEAGRPYQRLQEAGIEIARLDEIVRQKNSALEEAVEQLACGDVFRAIDNVDRQGRVQEIAGRDERLSQIASDYAREPQRSSSLPTTNHAGN